MLTFYEYPRCSTCRKAKAELKKLGLTFEAIDIKKTPPKAEQLKSWLETGPFNLKSYFNTSGNSYRQLGLKDTFSSLSTDEALKLLAADGMLLKRPILTENGRILQIGYRTPYAELGL
ncbi:arsenate reductase family protein [Streptococcus chenjunshii]|uniref:Arsenate reductase family protein n=1 Tax=Streptococcus chenjunshii TaxID=2173853 RepID=A0A372KM75_9STRE|nr:arsenate reductase family protein [Streptococcus chenjunshii]AXQ79155.1 arsenate reductase family protein [Streptococcus chenjunshii]RFU50989.1 arsenate reductase family protein [Streptococcus chenjunshii]RFU53381.1 arsenate reductase family protein [Streptococcus chenjunshii]